MPLTKDQIYLELQQAGVNPLEYDLDEIVKQNNEFEATKQAVPQGVQPGGYTPLETVKKAGLRNILPTLGGGASAVVGAKFGAGLGALGGPAAPVTVPLGAILGAGAFGIGGSMLTSKVQESALKQVQGESEYNKNLQELELAKQQNPVSGFIGDREPMDSPCRNTKSFERVSNAGDFNILYIPNRGTDFNSGLIEPSFSI